MYVSCLCSFPDEGFFCVYIYKSITQLLYHNVNSCLGYLLYFCKEKVSSVNKMTPNTKVTVLIDQFIKNVFILWIKMVIKCVFLLFDE